MTNMYNVITTIIKTTQNVCRVWRYSNNARTTPLRFLNYTVNRTDISCVRMSAVLLGIHDSVVVFYAFLSWRPIHTHGYVTYARCAEKCFHAWEMFRRVDYRQYQVIIIIIITFIVIITFVAISGVLMYARVTHAWTVCTASCACVNPCRKRPCWRGKSAIRITQRILVFGLDCYEPRGVAGAARTSSSFIRWNQV